MNIKMYVLINDDIKIGKGKLAGQVGHAVATYFYRDVMKGVIDIKKIDEYMKEQKKIILKCNEDKLLELEKLGFIAIRDKGYTQLKPDTLTCVMLGVLEEEEEVPAWVKGLKLM